jgi:hypothetical protein
MIAFLMLGLISVLGFLCLSSGIETATRRPQSTTKR